MLATKIASLYMNTQRGELPEYAYEFLRQNQQKIARRFMASVGADNFNIQLSRHSLVLNLFGTDWKLTCIVSMPTHSAWELNLIHDDWRDTSTFQGGLSDMIRVLDKLWVRNMRHYRRNP